MEKLLLRESRGNGVVVLAVSGEVDVLTGPQLDEQLAALADGGLCRVVLDAAGLVFCDGSGITILIRARNRVVEQQGWLRLARVRPSLRRILGIVDLPGVLPVFDTVADAIDGTTPWSDHLIPRGPARAAPVGHRTGSGTAHETAAGRVSLA